jgi:NADPH2:quinone reductase
VILESVGGTSLAAAAQHIASHGIIVVFGNSSNEPTSISLYDFFGHKVRGCRPFSPIMQAIEIIGENPAVLISLMAKQLADALIVFERNWRELPQAITALRKQRLLGKACLHVDGQADEQPIELQSG